MPVYEFSCTKHGVFDEYRTIESCTIPSLCPKCHKSAERIFSLLTVKIIQNKKRLPLGTGSAGRMVSSKETGGMGVYIPSFGAMEQEEVDYIAEGAIEKEQSRVKKKKKTIQRKSQAVVQAFVDLANRTPRGQKSKAIRQAIKETGG
jgi:putative FmdB family regulatory protein